MGMGEELVSVIIPTYNREKTLMKSINSVLTQSYKNFELIIVDDNSIDSTESLILNIQDKRVRYIKNNTNLGPSEARNVGIKNSKGNYIAFHDSDDFWVENKLEKQMHLIKSDSQLGLVYTGFTNYYDDGRSTYIPSKAIDITLKEGFIYDSLLESNKIGTPTMLIKRECLDAVGGFDKNLYALEDWELSLRISKNSKIGFIDENLVHAYVSATGVNSNNENIIEALCYMINKYKIDLVQLSLIGSKVCDMMERCLYNDDYKLDYIKEKLIPNIIDNNATFDILLMSVQKTLKFKKYYDLLMRIETIDNISTFIKEKIERNNWSNIAIYGLGGIGKVLLRYFDMSNVNIKYGIDKNVTKVNGNIEIIQPWEMKNDIDVIIVTSLVDYNKIVINLEQYSNCKIISADQFFNE